MTDKRLEQALKVSGRIERGIGRVKLSSVEEKLATKLARKIVREFLSSPDGPVTMKKARDFARGYLKELKYCRDPKNIRKVLEFLRS